MVDAPWYIDVVVAVMLAGAALVQFIWLARNGHNIGRWMQGVGWLWLCGRFVYQLAAEGNVLVSAVAIPGLLAVALGSVLTAWKHLFPDDPVIWCIQQPEFRCHRADRIAEAKRLAEEP